MAPKGDRLLFVGPNCECVFRFCIELAGRATRLASLRWLLAAWLDLLDLSDLCFTNQLSTPRLRAFATVS